MLDAYGETLVTVFVIERHQHEVVDVLGDTVELDGAALSCRSMGCMGDRVALADQNTYPPISTPCYVTALL
jgi:hypothetical protein